MSTAPIGLSFHRYFTLKLDFPHVFYFNTYIPDNILSYYRVSSQINVIAVYLRYFVNLLGFARPRSHIAINSVHNTTVVQYRLTEGTAFAKSIARAARRFSVLHPF
jgi:hypothetical protein